MATTGNTPDLRIVKLAEDVQRLKKLVQEQDDEIKRLQAKKKGKV